MINLIKAKDYNDMCAKAASFFFSQVTFKPNSVLGLATGSTPLGVYNTLIDWYKNGIIDFSKVNTVNLDEYFGLSGEHDQSYRYYMNTNLFDHINVDKANTNVPNGLASDIDAECQKYEDTIDSLGGIDIQLLGIGHNGHIGFNEPCEIFDKITHGVTLAQSTIDANARFFASADDVPKKAVTMGIGTIMKAKKVVLVANGAAKGEIIYKTCFGDVTPNVPASILQFHNDCTIIVDEECYKEMEKFM